MRINSALTLGVYQQFLVDFWPKMDTKALSNLVLSMAEAPSENLPHQLEARKELVTALRKLTTKLEDPVDSIYRFLFQVGLSHATF